MATDRSIFLNESADFIVMIFTLSIYSFPANRGYSEKPEVNRLNSITIRRGEVDILGNKLVRKSLGCIPPFELHSCLQQFIFL